MMKAELINNLTDAWVYGGEGTYDTDPKHIKEWLEDTSLWTDEDKATLEKFDLTELAEAIAEVVRTMA